MIFYIEPNRPFTNPAKWFVAFLAHHLRTDLVLTDKYTEGALKITDEADSDVPIALSFYNKIDKSIFNHQLHFNTEPLILTADGLVDYIATIFYMVNCLQEYAATDNALDKYKRFRYEDSYQSRFGTIRDNTVADLIEKFVETMPLQLRNEIPITSGRGVYLKKTTRPSQVFLTHDIDSLYSSFFQDGLWAIKIGRFDVLIRLIINELSRKPAYFNIDKMLNIHSEYHIKSTFFWIAAQGRSEDGIKNADYDLKNKRVQQNLLATSEKGFDIGLHKSSLNSSFEEEFGRLPMAHIKANRYHFLRFQLPDAWQTMADAGVQLDASLGFASQYGFRNGYGMPFRPYDFRTGAAMPLVVTPLNIMDGTLNGYMGIPEADILKHILDFFEKNKQNCTLGLLWHNTEFSEFRYAHYLKIYREILKYIVESKIKTVKATDILKTFE